MTTLSRTARARAHKNAAARTKPPRKLTLEHVKTAGAMFASLAVYYIVLAAPRFGQACAAGLLCAALYYFKKRLPQVLLFAGAALLSSFSLFTVYGALIPAAAVYGVASLLALRNKTLHPLTLAGALLVARLCLFFSGGSSETLFGYAVDIAVSGLFAVVATGALRAPLMRGLKGRAAPDEKVCISALVLVFYAGLYSVFPFEYNLMLTVAACTLLLSMHCLPLSAVLAYGLIAGGAAALSSGNPAFLGVLALYTLTASVFRDTSRILAALSFPLCDLLMGYYFNIFSGYSFWHTLSLAAGCGLYLCVTAKNLDRLKSLFGTPSERTLSRHIVNTSRAAVSRKLMSVGDVFYEMERIFKCMIKGYMSPESAVDTLSRDAQNEVCGDCPSREKCHSARLKEVENGYRAAVAAGIEKGKVTLLDLPAGLTAVCSRGGGIISAASRLSHAYRQYALVISNLDTGRALLGKQFHGVGDILTRLSCETRTPIGFDRKTERLILDTLAVKNIECSEVLVFFENEGTMNIALLVKNAYAHDKDISTVVSDLARTRMLVTGREESRRPGYTVLHLSPAPRYDVVFGAAGTAKSGSTRSGDTHSLTRIAGDKFILALCDGMGSGEHAEQTSSIAITLVENFYRAGFDSNTILASANRLLSVDDGDNFAALDICAVDLMDGRCDFIKLGAPEAYLKTRKATEAISGNSLPLGILDDFNPSVTTRSVTTGDMITLVSDGVSDAFGNSETLKEFVFASTDLNPQQLAEHLLEKAVSLSGNIAKDDMTVLTMRVFEKI